MNKEIEICRSIYLGHFKEIQDENEKLKEENEWLKSQNLRIKMNIHWAITNSWACSGCCKIYDINSGATCKCGAFCYECVPHRLTCSGDNCTASLCGVCSGNSAKCSVCDKIYCTLCVSFFGSLLTNKEIITCKKCSAKH